MMTKTSKCFILNKKQEKYEKTQQTNFCDFSCLSRLFRDENELCINSSTEG